jgi:ribonuclease G
MAEWLYEAGIGEERAILVESGAIRAARVDWGEPVRAGLVADAVLAARSTGARRGTVRLADGSEALVDALPRDVREGAPLRVRITRGAIAERGRAKLALARPAPDAELRPAPSLLEALRSEGTAVRPVRVAGPEFAAHGWDELVEEALSGEVSFAGGRLLIVPTPAMTLVDVDGALPAKALALAAARAAAAALPRLDIGGSVGIDFPHLADRRDRQAVDAALAAALGGWRHERTAMNGFGFVQLVSRLERPSLVARYARGSEAAARLLMRRAERVAEPGALRLAAPTGVRRAVRPEWEAELARRTGRAIEWRLDETLAPEAALAHAVPQ